MVRVVALVIKFKEILLSKNNQREIIRKVKSATLLNTSLLQEANTKLVKMVQQRSFKDEFQWLKSLKNSNDLNKALGMRSKISCLDPFLDGDGVIHVGGRLENSFLNNECKHPILLTKVGKITELLIKHHHKLAAHSGQSITLNEIRSSRYWIADANSAVKNNIHNCVECHRHRGRLKEQKMANLRSCKLNKSVLFTHCGIDMSGPIVAKQRRSEVKRNGAMFTCMTSRTIHIEVAFNLDTDSFILALRRLVARRGNVRSIYSDNGSNFIGAER